MRTRVTEMLAAAALLLPAGAEAQRVDCRAEASSPRASGGGPTGRAAEYNVVVDVPPLCVESLRLNVAGVDARLALDARVATLVRVGAGADVHLGEVDLGIRGVRAQALLLVDRDNVVSVVDRAGTRVVGPGGSR